MTSFRCRPDSVDVVQQAPWFQKMELPPVRLGASSLLRLTDAQLRRASKLREQSAVLAGPSRHIHLARRVAVRNRILVAAARYVHRPTS